MNISIYDQVVAPLRRSLENLDRIVTKAEQYAADRSIAPEVLIQARLRPDMLPFVSQVRIATDTAKGAAARLSGSEVPKWPDEESSFTDLHERIGKAVDYLGSFRPEQFDGAEERTIELRLRTREMRFVGGDYITRFVLPQFYFHVTTAYAILRHNGLEIGKADYLGDLAAD